MQDETSDVAVIPQLVLVARVQSLPAVNYFALLTGKLTTVAHCLVYELREPVQQYNNSSSKILGHSEGFDSYQVGGEMHNIHILT